MPRKPRALRPGDTIGLCAPSGPIEPDFVAAGIRELEGLGYRVLASSDLGRRTRFTWSETLHFPWWLGGRAGEAVGGKVVMRAIWRKNLRNLERLVEG